MRRQTASFPPSEEASTAQRYSCFIGYSSPIISLYFNNIVTKVIFSQAFEKISDKSLAALACVRIPDWRILMIDAPAMNKLILAVSSINILHLRMQSMPDPQPGQTRMISTCNVNRAQ